VTPFLAPSSPLWLVLLGGWAALDGTAVGPFMVSRPLPIGILAGFILGDPLTGLQVGLLLELLFLGSLPMGAARLPEPGPATLPAVAAAVGLGGGGGMLWAVVWGVVGAGLGGWTVTLQRRWNGWRTRGIERGDWTVSRLSRAHLSCLAVDALRGMGLVAMGLALLGRLPPERVAALPVTSAEVVGWVGVAAGVALGRVARRPRPLLIGLGVGIALVLLVGGS
jgi:mannose/fructose/N-acetylgalactosamine-specific phosphotransferase system component IIC